MVPGLASNTLLSGRKFADTDYISVYIPTEVNIYDAKTIKITVTEKAVLKGWRCSKSELWRILLQANITNINTDTLLLNSPDGRQSLNSLFTVPTTETVLDHLQILPDERPDTKEVIHHIYDLPSIEPAIQYLHTAVSFPIKATWLDAIQNGNFSTWPLIYVKNVKKCFPESEETQFGHMLGQRQNVQSTKEVPTKKDRPEEKEAESKSLEKKRWHPRTSLKCA